MELGIILVIVSSCIYILLGIGHTILTLFTNSFEPRDAELLALNKQTAPNITTQTSLWLGGVGFHLSHSLGFVIFGVLYLTLSIENPELITSSSTFNLGLIIIPLVYLLLSIRYWFIVPTIGIAISALGYFVGLVLLS